ncbi:hypothetical protein SAMN05216559_3784 [Halomicrobium zhouii]|uniref:Polysaccharide deacetylase n=1 Tax=Halomicrobium zhouii TaxID=767519 RepID=A0A1I6M4T2_9EURY|nr:hypothetical protein [Halomicrobium zhouii]SFS10690.1 hypothetical protein SAMN05216559_3784 [Halomicrobium zhouii]
MTRDFTYRTYARMLDAAVDAGYEFLTVREYLERETLPPRFLLLRHDVDRKPANALDFSRIEAERDVAATYYFRTVDRTLDPRVIGRVETLGHEIGYHYEDLDRANGDPAEAHRSFATNLAQLREYATVDTACMHGNPLTTFDNREMWGEDPDFDRYDLLGEAYLSVDFADVTYFSDAGRTWRDCPLKGDDHVVGQRFKTVQADRTADLVDLFRKRRVSRACLHAHPNRWADSYSEFVAERTRDAAVNAAKRGLQLLP